MERIIGAEVKSSVNGKGKVTSVCKSDTGYNVGIHFDNGDMLFSLVFAVQKQSIIFIDDIINTFVRGEVDRIIAENKEIEILRRARENEIIMQRKIEREQMLMTHLFPKGKNFGKITELKLNYFYGTRAERIYIECAENFGWDLSAHGSFARQQKLYANKVAGKYSVWFLAHSNLTRSRSEQWKNLIFGDTIEEEYEHPNYYCDIGDERIVFYKNEKQQYLFGGVYQQDGQYRNDNGHMVLIYKRISDHYPM